MKYLKNTLYSIGPILLSAKIFGQVELSENRYIDVYKKYENAPCPVKNNSIKNYVYFSRDREAMKDHPFLKVPQFEGAQIMYSWKQLEPEKGKYDFSEIKEDLQYLQSRGKKLFIQLQDTTFDPNFKAVPKYLLTDVYNGGASIMLQDNGENIGEPDGWVAKRWNKKVRKRFALLLNALGKEFDGKIEGINLQESAIGDVNDESFTPESYFKGLKANMLAMKKAFKESVTMQYANFMPGENLPNDDKGYLRGLYKYGQEIGVGLGGPDLMVKRKAQLNNTIAVMHEGKYTVPLGIAVQDGNYINDTNNSTVAPDHKNIVPLLSAFAEDFLKVNYMFWVNQEPYFVNDVLPCFNTR
ncbi:hypothetical protein [Elizabethkingia anophelis]|uniref:Glycoside hydrolase n=1 Tax=Elizabethkingia anophelis TaxID=1117645 RepID=A0AAU8VH40_9FLAO|nr:hypothetical protein [Elizabethkingia anophelis]AQX02236.1 hypothetical protein BBD32_12590 [Elizabethkingia anophelis]OPB61484.1 hypothetical protein BAY11_17685 [Elizabethkingia anophelis]